MKMYKVCFVISGFGYSGAEIVLERYLNDNMEIDPYFILIYKNEKIARTLINTYGADRVHSINLRHSKNRLRILPMYDSYLVKNRIEKYISIIKPEIIYANNTMEAMLMGEYINKNNIKSIAHIHDMKDSIRSYIRKKYTEKMLTRYNEIITVSEATKKQWSINEMKVIYNGIDKNYFKTEININEKIENIGFVGSISKRKGIDKIIDDIDSIVSNGNKIHIAYSNIDCSRLFEKLKSVSKIYPQNLFLYRDLDSDEIKKFYEKIDILVVPSRHDPLPTVIIEAIARNTLVIGNNVDGIPEILNNEDLIFDIKKDDAIISKINQLKDKDKGELEKIIIKLNNRCKSIFSDYSKKEKVNCIIRNQIGGAGIEITE